MLFLLLTQNLNIATGSYHSGHPWHSTPQYGIVNVGQLRYRAPIEVGPAAARDEPIPVFPSGWWRTCVVDSDARLM